MYFYSFEFYEKNELEKRYIVQYNHFRCLVYYIYTKYLEKNLKREDYDI